MNPERDMISQRSLRVRKALCQEEKSEPTIADMVLLAKVGKEFYLFKSDKHRRDISSVATIT